MADILPPIPYDKPQTSFEWIDWYTKLINLINSGTQHNELPGLQGGVGGEYYHLTNTQHTALTTDLSETIDDRVASLLVAGSNVSISYNDVANTLTISASGGGGGGGSIDDALALSIWL
jgi:hypothetical protein